jgi:hypothetical protein
MSRLAPACLAAALLVLTSCATAQVGPVLATSGAPEPPAASGPTARAPSRGSDPLCRAQPSAALPSPSSAPASLPPAIAAIVPQVEAARGLRFLRPVTPRPVTQEEMAAIVSESIDRSLPADEAAAMAKAWATIGVLPEGTDLLATYRELTASQVIGLYDETSKSLYFVGSSNPTPLERFTLAHELTHALDDQHFDLGRLDELTAKCQDDRVDAYTSLAEGDAMEAAFQWARDNLSLQELTEFGVEAAQAPPPPASTPPFLIDLIEFPYTDGQAFVDALRAQGGQGAVDAAFTDPPASTEQILHPDRYAGDAPESVAVPRLAARLGAGWRDLDVQEVGEEWLRHMLALRLDEAQADAAAEGWDGGQYRAFADSDRVAVVMDTAWDSPDEAEEFAQAIREWVGGDPFGVETSGSRVRVLFASDATALETLQAAA